MQVQQRSYLLLARQRFQDNIAGRCIMISRISYTYMNRDKSRHLSEKNRHKTMNSTHGTMENNGLGQLMRRQSILRFAKYLSIFQLEMDL